MMQVTQKGSLHTPESGYDERLIDEADRGKSSRSPIANQIIYSDYIIKGRKERKRKKEGKKEIQTIKKKERKSREESKQKNVLPFNIHSHYNHKEF